MKVFSVFILQVVFLTSFTAILYAGSISDKLFEAVDNIKDGSQEIGRAVINTKDKVSDSYLDYQRRKSVEEEKKRIEKKRIENAVKYYEEEKKNKDLTKSVTIYADPCLDQHSICKPDKLGQKWCWFPGQSRALCSQVKSVSKEENKTLDPRKLSLKSALDKKKGNCRQRAYEEWANNIGSDEDVASSLSDYINLKCK